MLFIRLWRWTRSAIVCAQRRVAQSSHTEDSLISSRAEDISRWHLCLSFRSTRPQCHVYAVCRTRCFGRCVFVYTFNSHFAWNVPSFCINLHSKCEGSQFHFIIVLRFIPFTRASFWFHCAISEMCDSQEIIIIGCYYLPLNRQSFIVNIARHSKNQNLRFHFVSLCSIHLRSAVAQYQN